MAVTNQELFNIFLANPNMSDAQIVSLMETRGISPAQVSQTFGLPEGQIAARVGATLPPNQAVLLGDTYVQAVNPIQGSGENEQVGALENVITYKASENKVGGNIQYYSPTGEYQQTTKQQEVNATKDFLKFAAGAGALFGGGALLNSLTGGAGALATEGLTLGELGLGGFELGAVTNVADIVAGTEAGLLTGTPTGGLMGTGTGLTAAGAGGLSGAMSTLGGEAALGTGIGAGSAAVGSTLSGLETGVGTGLLSSGLTGSALANGALTNLGGAAANTLLGNAVTGGLGLAGGVLQQQQSREAAQTAAQNVKTATQQAVEASQFRPVGMTTRFGTSNYTYDPVTGRMTSAGYQLSPEAKAAQDRLVGLAGRGLSQAEQAQSQFAPLQTAAQNLYSLGSQYIAKSPEEAAQDYINKQMQLLQPSRELDLANLQNRLFQQGRTGVSVAQGGTLGATTPELQALYNARAMQDLQLASQATQAGQANTLFGSNLYDLGTAKLSNYYGGQAQAYQPFTTALGQVQNLETQAQQPLAMGANLAQQASTAGARAGQLGLTGAQIQGNLMTSNAVTNNPYAAFLSGLGSPTSTLGQGLANYITGYNPTADQNAVLNPYLFNTGSVWNG